MAMLYALFTVSCTPQEDCTLDCLNNGVCIDGDCYCPNGFTGIDCGLEIEIDTTSPTILPCDTVSCFNGGTCLDGDCECTDGFGGADCSLTYAQLLNGSYIVANQSGCYPASFASDVIALNDSVITVSNFKNLSDSLIMTVGYDDIGTMTIDTQTIVNGLLEYSVWGNGVFDPQINSFILNVSYDLFGNMETCVEEYVKQ